MSRLRSLLQRLVRSRRASRAAPSADFRQRLAEAIERVPPVSLGIAALERSYSDSRPASPGHAPRTSNPLRFVRTV